MCRGSRLTAPSGATSAAPRIGYGKSSPTALLITFWKKILIAPVSDRESASGGGSRSRAITVSSADRLHNAAEREEELAVVGDRDARAHWLEAPAGRSAGAARRE